MKKKINLDDIIDQFRYEKPMWSSLEFDESNIKDAMLEFGRQLLKLASDRAEISSFECEEYWMTETFNMVKDELGNISAVNKQSILDTLKQVE